VWFDAIRTYDRSGIGAHFDHSDNIVLQQSGTKEWSVSSPEHIPRADIARRMMNVSGVGGRELPAEGVLRFTLQPGDLLYLPLFWVHSGVSLAESLSISVVCPSVSLHRAVLPLLAEAARGHALGHQPIPAFHAYLPAEERDGAARRLREATAALLRRLSDDEMVTAVHALQTRRLPGLDGGTTPVAR
jgi:50S ribosomal protein L16 3-hydroxylase